MWTRNVTAQLVHAMLLLRNSLLGLCLGRLCTTAICIVCYRSPIPITQRGGQQLRRYLNIDADFFIGIQGKHRNLSFVGTSEFPECESIMDSIGAYKNDQAVAASDLLSNNVCASRWSCPIQLLDTYRQT